MAGASWNSIRISKDTYEKMKVLSANTGLSMDSIIRELITYPDSIVPSETRYLGKATSFYDFLKGAREYMIKQGWSSAKNVEEAEKSKATKEN